MNKKPFEDEPTKTSSRKGRYRKQLVVAGFFEKFANSFSLVFNELWKFKEEKHLNEGEFVGYGLMTMLACRRKDAFQKFTPQKQNEIKIDRKKSFGMADFFEVLKKHDISLDESFESFYREMSLEECLSSVRFRGIPDSARLSLLQWVRNDYPLQLLGYIPNVDEVFAMQLLGKRCVTFFMQADELLLDHHGRDALSFVVHDLIHAHEFYENRQRTKQQIGFYLWLQSISSIDALQYLIHSSKEFKEYWDYLRSDMNSYCGHLLKTLEATLTIHSKEIDPDFHWGKLIDLSDLPLSDKNLFKKINTKDWSDEDFIRLENIFESLLPD